MAQNAHSSSSSSFLSRQTVSALSFSVAQCCCAPTPHLLSAMSEPIRRSLSLLSRSHMNSRCADCRAREPTFASHAIGVFLCERCAVVHRTLHARAAQAQNAQAVLSIMFDVWTAEQAEKMNARGNLQFNMHAEALLPVGGRPGPDATAAVIEEFLRRKYFERAWWSDTPRQCVMIPAAAASGADIDPAAVPAAATATKGDARRERMNRAAPVNALEQMEADIAKGSSSHESTTYTPVGARAAAVRLAGSSGQGPIPAVHPLVTFVLTSSAMPSNPSLELVEKVIGSCEECLGMERHRPDEQKARNEAETLAADVQAEVAALTGGATVVDASGPSACAGSAASAASSPSAPALPLLKCLLILTLDGYGLDPSLPVGAKPKFKNGLLDQAAIEAYEEYKNRLRELAKRQPYQYLHILLLELPFRQGFAGAVHQCLQFVSSEFMFVLQHDWMFVAKVPHSMWLIIQAMQRNQPTEKEQKQQQIEAAKVAEEIADESEVKATMAALAAAAVSPSPSSIAVSSSSPSPSPSLSSSSPSPSPSSARLPINYVTFQSSTTLGYLSKDYHDVARHVGKAVHRMHYYDSVGTNEVSAGDPNTSCVETDPLPLCPAYFWFDRNHIVRSSFYRQRVFGAYRFMRSAAFIEDTFGQLMLNMLRGSYHGAKNHAAHPFEHYASFIYYPCAGNLCLVDHAHGRKFITDKQRETQYGARDEQAQEKMNARKERDRKAAEELERGAAAASAGSAAAQVAPRQVAEAEEEEDDMLEGGIGQSLFA